MVELCYVLHEELWIISWWEQAARLPPHSSSSFLSSCYCQVSLALTCFLQVFRFPLFCQKHARKWTGYTKLPQMWMNVWMYVCSPTLDSFRVYSCFPPSVPGPTMSLISIKHLQQMNEWITRAVESAEFLPCTSENWTLTELMKCGEKRKRKRFFFHWNELQQLKCLRSEVCLNTFLKYTITFWRNLTFFSYIFQLNWFMESLILRKIEQVFAKNEKITLSAQ